MQTQLHINRTLALITVALAFSFSAQAGASRTFVATTGNDTNVSSNCGATTPCRTFGAALSVTNAGGEIVVVSSGGYGAATISQPVLITAVGVDASISIATFGGDGFDINTTGNVTLIGLSLHAAGKGADGIHVIEVGHLRLYDIFIEGFSDGIVFGSAGTLTIEDSTLNDNAIDGIEIPNSAAEVYVNRSSIVRNGIGFLSNGTASVSDSNALFNGNAFEISGGTLSLFYDRVASNNKGLVASGGNLYFAHCLLDVNGNSYAISGGTIAGTSPGTSLITPNQGTSGTLSTPIAVH